MKYICCFRFGRCSNTLRRGTTEHSIQAYIQAQSLSWLPLWWGPLRRILTTTVLRDPVKKLRPSRTGRVLLATDGEIK